MIPVEPLGATDAVLQELGLALVEPLEDVRQHDFVLRKGEPDDSELRITPAEHVCERIREVDAATSRGPPSSSGSSPGAIPGAVGDDIRRR